MRKKGLLQTHRLLMEVYAYLDEQQDITLDKYSETDAESMDVHRRKHEHKEAIQALLTDITAALETEDESEEEEERILDELSA